MRATVLLLGAIVVGCEDPPGTTPTGPVHPCASDSAGVEVAPPGGVFGDLSDGGTLWCGSPPQGGAPYTPFRLRFAGPEAFKDGVHLDMTAVDVDDGTELAHTTLDMGVTCANVGDNAGLWVGSEAHMRYTGFSLEDLDGRQAELVVRASGQTDPTTVVLAAEVMLTLILE